MGINSKQVSRSQYMIQLKQYPQQQDPAERQASIHQKLLYNIWSYISSASLSLNATTKKKIHGTDVASCCDLQFLSAICGAWWEKVAVDDLAEDPEHGCKPKPNHQGR